LSKGKVIKEFTGITLKQLPEIAGVIAGLPIDRKIWWFEGTMGAGKTTLIKALCQQWQVEDEVTSPTFAIINEYADKRGEIYYHFDFYRLNDVSEAMDVGVEEYLDSGRICLMEWAEKIITLVPDKFLRIFIHVNPDRTRNIVLELI